MRCGRYKSRRRGASFGTQGSQRKNMFSFLLIADSRNAEEGKKEKNLRSGNMPKTWWDNQKHFIENNMMLP
jgi:hypothetical protein